MDRGAYISKCGKYRYGLWRQWDSKKSSVAFFMLNPSTADGTLDDPTIRRCIRYAYDWGYGGLYVVNLSPYRATDPKILSSIILSDRVIENNATHIRSLEPASDKFICSWGANKVSAKVKDSLKDVMLYLQSKGKLFKLGLNKNGTPKHPLYLSKELLPTKFEV